MLTAKEQEESFEMMIQFHIVIEVVLTRGIHSLKPKLCT